MWRMLLYGFDVESRKFINNRKNINTSKKILISRRINFIDILIIKSSLYVK